jgi:hypothetical protein
MKTEELIDKMSITEQVNTYLGTAHVIHDATEAHLLLNKRLSPNIELLKDDETKKLLQAQELFKAIIEFYKDLNTNDIVYEN